MASALRSNFAHLGRLQADLARLGGFAEHYFPRDPNTCLLKLRQFAELMAQQVAARAGLYDDQEDNQLKLLNRLQSERWLAPDIAHLFHVLRKVGNAAMHQGDGDHRLALESLKYANQLGHWFQRTFGDNQFRGGAFIPPVPPVDESEALHEELVALRVKLQQFDAALSVEAEKSQSAADDVAKAKADADLWAELAQSSSDEADALKAQLAELRSLQAQAVEQPAATINSLFVAATEAAKELDLDEAATRLLIDQQLRDAGWEADTSTLDYRKGTRPEPGRNLAIAEWPTESGPADYAFFIGTECVAVAEAKRSGKNVSAAIDQAKRYARGFIGDGGELPKSAWQNEFRVPLVFSSNGRSFQRQYLEASGIWFCDLRRAQNLRKPLTGWHTPEDIKALLKQDVDAAQGQLDAMPMVFDFLLRSYQEQAIHSIEDGIKRGSPSLLVAMATGTGKTKTAIALVYRLLKAQRFRRILFLVDRSALGEQAADSFKDTRMENLQSFADIFSVKEIDETAPDADTKVHIATVQGMVKRVLLDDEYIPVGAYDCIVVDECHRGYLLDREMSQAESEFRDQSDYISKYRRVLDHFDAVKIGLTATPALHTTQVFGEPVFTYSYREAVIDGHLIDHEPAIRIKTELSEGGIHYQKDDDIKLLDLATHTVNTARAPDNLDFDVSEFNKKVITESFNRVVCEELTQHINPYGPDKTLVFCAADQHADLVVRLLKEAFQARGFADVGDGSIQKITGAADKPLSLIKHFKNEKNPVIAVTVDLLTTGIDVPAISNLVFLRRVNSRILYEQMLGRATRRCDDIGKEIFRIYDAVDLYRNLEPVNSMKPVVQNPNIGYQQLIDEICKHTDQPIAEQARDQLLAKWQSKRRHLSEAQQRALEQGGIDIESFARFVKHAKLPELADWLRLKTGLGELLDTRLAHRGDPLVISDHKDALREVSPVYGKPDDYLERFNAFIASHSNTLPALVAVVQRPRDLTRQHLRQLVAALEGSGFDEASLTHAWASKTNHEIAARVLGFVRQAALGEPLIPWDQRVESAVQALIRRRGLNPNQQNWLKRIAQQIKATIVLDESAINEGPLREAGGFRRLNQFFEGQLGDILADFNEAIWQPAANQ